MEYKPKRVGRPNGSDDYKYRKRKYRQRGKPKYPGPGSKLRKTQYKVMNLNLVTHQMVKELAAYYKVSMMGFVHKIIEAAFKKTLIEVERKDKEETEAYERYKAEVTRRRKEKEDALKNQHQP
jgi:hypothetical protein